MARADFKTHDRALKAARDLKGRFPMLEIKVYDAEKKGVRRSSSRRPDLRYKSGNLNLIEVFGVGVAGTQDLLTDSVFHECQSF